MATRAAWRGPRSHAGHAPPSLPLLVHRALVWLALVWLALAIVGGVLMARFRGRMRPAAGGASAR